MLFTDHHLRTVARASMPTGAGVRQERPKNSRSPKVVTTRSARATRRAASAPRCCSRLSVRTASRTPMPAAAPVPRTRPPSERQRRDSAEEVDRLRARRRGCRRDRPEDQAAGGEERQVQQSGLAKRGANHRSAARVHRTARACPAPRRRLTRSSTTAAATMATTGQTGSRPRAWASSGPSKGSERVPATASRSTVSASEARASAPCPWPSRRPRSCRPTK